MTDEDARRPPRRETVTEIVADLSIISFSTVRAQCAMIESTMSSSRIASSFTGDGTEYN